MFVIETGLNRSLIWDIAIDAISQRTLQALFKPTLQYAGPFMITGLASGVGSIL